MKRRIKKGLIGKKFGRLTVIGDAGTNKDGQLLWKCECKCGKFTKAKTQDLQQGKKKHCGCLDIKLPILRNVNPKTILEELSEEHK